MAQSSVPGGNMFTVSFYLRNVRHNRKVTFFFYFGVKLIMPQQLNFLFS